MPEEVPADVQAVLTQLFTEGQTALSEGDPETARDIVTTIEEVATNKLPEGPLRSRLRHGCERIVAALAEEDDVEQGVAAGYLQAMERQLDRATE